ncbi:MAG: CPBP family intramembrane glutamic endopeptidase [Dokdonella sp.]
MNAPVGSDTSPKNPMQRLVHFAPVRAVLAIFLTALAGGLTLTYLGEMTHPSGSEMWPEFGAVVAVLAAYWLYVRVVERRAALEISRKGAIAELATGALVGVGLVVCVVGLVNVLGSYRVVGANPWTMSILRPLAMMTFVGVLEEVISRGIIFRITEASLGSWAGLGISSALFGLAHLPGDGASGLAIAVTVVAGVMFAASYMVTRRLWLAIGIHVSWNYTLGSIFSVAVSGRDAQGLLIGQTSGPELLTGGAYGFEASVVALIVLGAVAAFFLRVAFVRGHFLSFPVKQEIRK